MENHTPPLERDTMVRVGEENRNVRVTAWIYAIKYEADQHLHVILGSDPDIDEEPFFSAEISGLPLSSSSAHSTLLKVPQTLADILGNELPGGSKYRKYKRPIPVVIEGSLFFDIDHKAGVVGPEGMRAETALEIHPVTKIRGQ